MSEASLRGKTAVVVGASSGIGAAVARALASEGVRLALAARREEVLEEVRESLSGADSLIFPTDVTDRDGVRALVRRAEEEFGPVEILVNCAGVMYFTLMANAHEDEWERTVRINCQGALNCIGAALPGMLTRGKGHIVTISSDAGRKVFPGLAVYSASKFFVEALSQGLRLEMAGTGVKVTTVQPGNVGTGLLGMSTDEEALEQYGEPTGARVLDPEDVAASVVWA
ncbi:MAG: SDR family oxidoreductase, partial [Rubrobacter sp.]|nr:SDR family oxidoreductase [Rubrobacter sp.]